MSRKLLTLLGVLLIAASAVVPNGVIEAGFAGRTAGSLAWGPVLFRILLALHGGLLVLAARVPRSQSPAHGLAIERRDVLVLAGLTLLAVGLRLWKLNSCLWLDEVFTLLDFVRPSFGEIFTSFPNQNQHMLYSLAAHLSIRSFGESAWALRLPSVVFGAASLWALFLLGRRIATAREALLACALMTVSYHHIWFSQNARGYMGLLLFATLSTWLWLEALSEDRWGWWIAYSAACFLGAWIHMTMVFVVASHVLIWAAELLIRRGWAWRALVKPLAAWTLAGSLSLQVYALALPEFLRSAVHEASMNSEWTRPLWVFGELLRGLRVGFSGAAVIACGGLLVLAGWMSILRRSPRAAAAMVLPAFLGGASMLALEHNLWPRFFFFSMGFALIVVIRGAMALPELLLPRAPLAKAAGLALVGALVAASLATVPRCYRLPKQDFLGARDYAERLRAPGSLVATAGMGGLVYKRYFAPHWAFAETEADLEAIEKRDPNLTLVYSLPVELKAFQPGIWKMLENDFQPVRTFPGTLGGGDVYVCRLRGTARRPAPEVNLQ